jgi:hypothetical protein
VDGSAITQPIAGQVTVLGNPVSGKSGNLVVGAGAKYGVSPDLGYPKTLTVCAPVFDHSTSTPEWTTLHLAPAHKIRAPFQRSRDRILSGVVLTRGKGRRVWKKIRKAPRLKNLKHGAHAVSVKRYRALFMDA